MIGKVAIAPLNLTIKKTLGHIFIWDELNGIVQ